MTSWTRALTASGSTMLSIRSNFIIQQYPDPQSSIGPNDAGIPFCGKTLWHKQGPAEVAYQTVEADIESCITKLGMDLYSKTSKQVGHHVQCYMWGRRKSNANPFIVIFSKDKNVRENIKTTIKGQSWWETFIIDNQGFGRFLLSKDDPCRFGVDDQDDDDQDDDDQDDDDQDDDDQDDYVTPTRVYTSRTIDTFYSAPLWFENAHHTTSTAQQTIENAQARLGGIIFSDGRPFGLTVSHPSMHQDSQDSVIEEDESEDEAFYADDDDIDDSNSSTDRASDSTDTSRLAKIIPQTPHVIKRTAQNPSVEARSGFLGNIVCRSEDSVGADWAIIELKSRNMHQSLTELLTRPRILLGKQYLSDDTETLIYAPRSVKALPRETTSVFIVGRSGQLMTGSLGTSESLVWLAGNSQYTRLATVLIDEPLAVGDCGMWVFDHDGNLYGHIIGGIVGTGIAYLASSIRIIEAAKSNTRFAIQDISLVPQTSVETSLVTAVRSGMEMDVELLLRNGADPKVVSNRHSALNHGSLFHAARLGYREIVELLLAQPGIDVNLGEPLSLAIQNGHEEVAELLRAHLASRRNV